MTTIQPAQAAGADALKAITGQQSLRTFSEQRSVSLDTSKNLEQRERMAQTLKFGEERSLLEATKNLAANVFGAFRNELREALIHVGIGGEKAAELVREVGKAFVEAVREGTGFSFALIAAAYRETITQTGTQVSHGLEFSASTLTIEYNHVTGEIIADTSRMEIDAVKLFSSDNLPSQPTALFDFTDGDGTPGIAQIFDRVRQYLEKTGFVDAANDGNALPALPAEDPALYDTTFLNGEAAKPAETDKARDGAERPAAEPGADGRRGNIRIRAIEEFANGRRETVTRLTVDLMVRVYLGKESSEPEVFRLDERNDESFRVMA